MFAYCAGTKEDGATGGITKRTPATSGGAKGVFKLNDFKYIAPIAVLICLCLIAFNAVLYKIDDLNQGNLSIKCAPVLPIFIDDLILLENFGDGIYILESGFITECEAVE